MKPADYTLPLYKQQLSQHVWEWDQRVSWPTTRKMYSEAEENLKQVAHERGGEFLEAFNQHSPQTLFPFAGIPASEIQDNKIPNPNTPMKIEIILPDDLFNPLVQAINNLTEAVKAGGSLTPQFTVTASPQCGPTVTATVTEPTPEPEKAKAGRPKKDKAAPEPEPTPTPAAEPTVEAAPAAEPTPEPAPAEAPKVKVPTGPELSEKVKPLAAHPELQQDLIRYKANELKVNGPIRLVTDTDTLAKFDAKVDELLAKIPAEV